MSDVTEERQTTGKISYNLGLTAVIDLDADPQFANLDDTTRQSMIRTLSYEMIKRADEYFETYEGVHQVTLPEVAPEVENRFNQVQALKELKALLRGLAVDPDAPAEDEDDTYLGDPSAPDAFDGEGS